MAGTRPTERGPQGPKPEHCPCLHFRTDSPELYRGRRTTTCPSCGRRDVLVLRCLDGRVHISQHRVPAGETGEVTRG